jgi:hypothetical protein
MEIDMNAALLPDRGIVRLSGDDSRRFLNGLITADVTKPAPNQGLYAALLTPQGKIIADFLVVEATADDGGGFLLDCPRGLAGTLVGKLNFYKLRAKVSVEDQSDRLGVMAVWGGSGTGKNGLTFTDPRLPKLGARIILPPGSAAEAAAGLGARLTGAEAYDAHRIALGVPQGGSDFSYGDAFPHEANMDQFGGLDFEKGCYIGQEVVSRVEHRATARSRVVPVVYEGTAPKSGLPVMTGDKTIGVIGSMANGRGLALLRLDRVAEAMAASVPLLAGGIPIRPVKPAWAQFPWPGAPETP